MATDLGDLCLGVEEFLRFEGEPDRRYELVDGRIRMMAAPGNEHGVIAGNCWGEIDRRVENRPPCRAQVEAGIRISDDTFYVADVVMACTPTAREQAVRDPLLIVEVLSPGTCAQDKGRKLDDYKALPSVAEIWLVDAERRTVQVWWRESEGWAARDHLGSARFESRILEDTIPLDRLYRNTGL